jgi:ferredoxin
MPRRNGTGPQGKGPMTGRRAGRWSGNSPGPGYNIRNQQGGLFSSFKRWFSGRSNTMPRSRGGLGIGRGRGMGRGMNRGMGNFYDPYSKFPNEEFYNMNRETGNRDRPGGRETAEKRILNKDQALQEAEQLREKARQIEEELNTIQKKINDLESKKSVSKQLLVDKDLCMGCGRCEDVCPYNAISVRDTAEIDQNLCTLCGRCINECPAGALRIA